MADWQQFEQRIQELERKRKPSQNRRAVFEVIKSSNLQPHPDFDASLYLGPLVDLAGQPICLEYTNDRPNLWFHARHAEKLEKAGLKLERKPPIGAESEDRHAGLKGKGFKDIDAFRLGGLDPAVTRSALAALGMLKAEGGDLKVTSVKVV